jgi:HEAT repeat protein
MAKGDARKGLEQQLAELNALRDGPDTPDARAALAKALDATRAPLAAAAANIIGEAELAGFAPALVTAFARFIELPAKSDAGCVAKTSCARALYRLGERATEVFLRGIGHVQMEPVWGGQQDTAIELRGTCALGLVRAGYPDALVELAELLADEEPMARVAAAQAIAYSERADIGVPLLRMKARLGDDDPRVTAACFSALFSLSPELSLHYVAGFLDADKVEVQEAALIALGESRLPAALPVLQSFIARLTATGVRAVAFTAVGLLRSEAGWDYLLTTIRDGGRAAAQEALDTLATYRGDEKLRDRALTAAEASGDPALHSHAARVMG